MTKKAFPVAVAVIALLGAACAGPTEGSVDFGKGEQFVPAIADTLDNVGLMPSVALDGEGVPYVVYFGFTQEAEAGQPPVTRPVTAPFVPSVLMASQSEGVFKKGAVAMTKPAPTGVTIPFGPAEQPELKSITPENVNGTAIATDASGGLHVAYVTDSGLYYGNGGPGASFEIQLVLPIRPKLKQAGPVGPPAITVDADGNPLIAYGISRGGGPRIEVAVYDGRRFQTQTVAPLNTCPNCPQPLDVGIGMTDDGPMVTYTDPGRGGAFAATRDNKGNWKVQAIDPGGGGFGLSMAVDGAGTPSVSYYDGRGAVLVATKRGGSWRPTPVADVGTSQEPVGEGGLVTGLGVDDEGVRTVAYVNVVSDAVEMSSDPKGGFAPLDVAGTEGGRYPSVAVSGDGVTTYVTWYDAVNGNLGLGTFAETNDLAVARPSPTASASAAPPPSPTTQGVGGAPCQPRGTVANIVAQAGAAANGFQQDCYAVDANKPFTLNLENQDTGVPHNVAIYTDSSATKKIVVGKVITGQAKEAITGPALDPGQYYFRCDVHPTTMSGTFVAS